METVLEFFSLAPVRDEATLQQVFNGAASSTLSEADKLKCWLALLPQNIADLIQIALRQERPFLPPGVTPEMMAAPNETLVKMNHIEILYRSIAQAVSASDLQTAAALVYVVDRASYRFGASRALLKVVDFLLEGDTSLAPQVILRKARVMKDDGDLHGAMRVLDAVIKQESVWNYQNEDQYNNVKAVCVQIKGQILHNLGLWKDAIGPLVESILAFQQIHDDKGTSSSYGLLTKCLKKLSQQDFNEVKVKFPDMFCQGHPCYEAYVQGMEAVRYIKDLGQTLYVAKHQLVAEEALLMFALQQTSLLTEFRWFQTIIDETKRSLSNHETVDNLKSTETFFEFVRAIFMISMTLSFSPVPQDRSLSRYLEQISMELYRHLCSAQSRIDLVTGLDHTRNSVSFMNAVLGILGLPPLQGCDDVSIAAQTSAGSSSGGDNSGKSNETKSEKNLKKSNETNITQNLEQMSLSKTNLKSATSPSGGDHLDGKDENRHAAATFPGARVENKKPVSGSVYLRSYVGLPSDPTRFSSVSTSSSSSSYTSSSDQVDLVSSCSPDAVDSDLDEADLVNLSVLSVSATAERLDQEELVDPSGINRSTSKQSQGSQDADSSSSRSSKMSEYSFLEDSSKTSSYSFCEDSDSKSPQKSASSDPLSSYVDLSAPTKDWSQEESEEFSPLVDLSRSTVPSSFESLNLGSSVETDNPVEFFQHWQPSEEVDASIKVHKSLLLTYNPVTGQWISQSTVAHLGSMLDLGSNKKGNCRDAFNVSFLHQDEPLGRYVGKRYRNQRPAKYYMQDVVCQMMAGYYVTKFNQALQDYHSDIQVQFLPAAHLQLLTPGGHLHDWINVEPYLHGKFIKLTNNLAYSNRDEHRGKDLATALTHFSYAESQGVLMIVDIQGWLPSEDSGIVYLTDPQFHTCGIRKFSPADGQEKGMKLFWNKVHPQCNSICTALNLRRPE